MSIGYLHPTLRNNIHPLCRVGFPRLLQFAVELNHTNSKHVYIVGRIDLAIFSTMHQEPIVPTWKKWYFFVSLASTNLESMPSSWCSFLTLRDPKPASLDGKEYNVEEHIWALLVKGLIGFLGFGYRRWELVVHLWLNFPFMVIPFDNYICFFFFRLWWPNHWWCGLSLCFCQVQSSSPVQATVWWGAWNPEFGGQGATGDVPRPRWGWWQVAKGSYSPHFRWWGLEAYLRHISPF